MNISSRELVFRVSDKKSTRGFDQLEKNTIWVDTSTAIIIEQVCQLRPRGLEYGSFGSDR
jgi:hypothetical protein